MYNTIIETEILQTAGEMIRAAPGADVGVQQSARALLFDLLDLLINVPAMLLVDGAWALRRVSSQAEARALPVDLQEVGDRLSELLAQVDDPAQWNAVNVALRTIRALDSAMKGDSSALLLQVPGDADVKEVLTQLTDSPFAGGFGVPGQEVEP